MPTYGLRAKVRRMGWATLTEHKWIISGERRGAGAELFKMDGGKAMLKTVAGGSLGAMMDGKNIVLKILSRWQLEQREAGRR